MVFVSVCCIFAISNNRQIHWIIGLDIAFGKHTLSIIKRMHRMAQNIDAWHQKKRGEENCTKSTKQDKQKIRRRKKQSHKERKKEHLSSAQDNHIDITIPCILVRATTAIDLGSRYLLSICACVRCILF